MVDSYIHIQEDPTPAEEGLNILKGLRTSIRILGVTTIILFLAVGGIAVWGLVTSDELRDATCALRTDLERRIQVSKDFLINHPDRARSLGIPELKASIANQEQTVKALSGVDCE